MSTRPAVTGAVAAGVMDAGLASLATFATGLFAIRYLEPRALGAYALIFAAFNLLAVVPAQLLFVPAEVAAVGFPRGERIALLPHSLRAGLPAAALAAAALPAWALAAPRGIPPATAGVLTASAVACTFLSPVQDHLRRMLHTAGRSGTAALVSAVQLAVVVAAAAAFLGGMGIDAAWVPFGALAAANALSLAAGIAAARPSFRAPAPPELGTAALARSGGWLLLVGLIAPASGFAAGSVVGRLAGAEAVGIAEAARVIGHPVLVLATGLSAVLGPHSVRAAREGRVAAARRIDRAFAALTLGLGAAYLAAVSAPWALNPFPALVPRAYAVAGLAAAAIVAAMVNGALYPSRSELLGVRGETAIVRADAAGAALRVAAAATAGVTHAFAVPLGFLALGAARWIGYRRTLARVYGRAAGTGRTRVATPGEAVPREVSAGPLAVVA